MARMRNERYGSAQAGFLYLKQQINFLSQSRQLRRSGRSNTLTTLKLGNSEIAVLMKQDPATKNDGGFQSFLVQLQQKIDSETGEITLSPRDLERIPQYAFDYGNGGWETTLQSAFGRHLGPKLGRL